jgi:hypothetical protein
LMTTVEEVYLKNYIYREPINILEELNDPNSRNTGYCYS